MEFEKVIRERKATRLFSSKQVEDEKIEKILIWKEDAFHG